MTSTSPYKAGDQVELISGSPDMTVLHCDKGSVWLAWCGDDDTGVLHQAELPIGAVQPIKNTSPRSPGASGGYGHRAPQPGLNRAPLSSADLDDEIPF